MIIERLDVKKIKLKVAEEPGAEQNCASSTICIHNVKMKYFTKRKLKNRRKKFDLSKETLSKISLKL